MSVGNMSGGYIQQGWFIAGSECECGCGCGDHVPFGEARGELGEEGGSRLVRGAAVAVRAARRAARPRLTCNRPPTVTSQPLSPYGAPCERKINRASDTYFLLRREHIIASPHKEDFGLRNNKIYFRIVDLFSCSLRNDFLHRPNHHSNSRFFHHSYLKSKERRSVGLISIHKNTLYFAYIELPR